MRTSELSNLLNAFETSLSDSGATAERPTEVIVGGPRPLTRSMVNRLIWWSEWALDLRVPPATRQMLEERIVAEWKAGDATALAGYEQLLNMEQQLQPQNQETRDAIREELQPGVVSLLRAQVGEPGARALIELYDRANAPIAPGNPPLTHEIANCYIDLTAFLQALAVGSDWQPVGEPQRSQQLQWLAAQYPHFSPAQQAWLGGLPRGWTALRAGWRNTPPEMKETVRQQILTNVGGVAGSMGQTQSPSFTPGNAAGVSTGGRTAVAAVFDMQGKEERAIEERIASALAAGNAVAAEDARAALRRLRVEHARENAGLASAFFRSH